MPCPVLLQHSILNVAEVTQERHSSGKKSFGTKDLTAFKSCCPFLDRNGALPLNVPFEWQCVPAPVSHSAHDDTIYTFIVTIDDRILQH